MTATVDDLFAIPEDERRRSEPLDLLPLRVGALFGDDDAEPAEDR